VLKLLSMDKRRIILVCALVGLAGAPAFAMQSLKSIRAQQAESEALESEIAYTNSICGGDITSHIDWSSASSWPEDESLASACDGALSALEAICRAGADRASSISRFVCSGDGSGASLSGGTLEYGASPGENGFADTKEYLDGTL